MGEMRTAWVAVYLENSIENHHAFALERLMREHIKTVGRTYLVRTYRHTCHGDLASGWAAQVIDARAGSG